MTIVNSVARFAIVSTSALLCSGNLLWSQTPQQATALANATAAALEARVRSVLADGHEIRFEARSPWDHEVANRLEKVPDLMLDSENVWGAVRIQMIPPYFKSDRAFVEVWFGRCGWKDEEQPFRAVGYVYKFRHLEGDWQFLGDDRFGETAGRCGSEWEPPAPAQTSTR